MLFKHSEQQMLGADLPLPQFASLSLRTEHNSTRTVRETLKHGNSVPPRRPPRNPHHTETDRFPQVGLPSFDRL